MKIIIHLTPNTSLVPYNYQRNLVGTFHKWLGENQIHDETSLYSLSWLIGGRGVKGGLEFRNGATWNIAAFDLALLKILIRNIQKDPEVNFGMAVESISICEEPKFAHKEKFYLASPIFVKRAEAGKIKFYLFDTEETDLLMTHTLQTKMKKAGVSHKGVQVYFDRSYPSPKTKHIVYNGIACKASYCPVIIEGTSEQIAFAWNVGIGNSTGIGFGALK
ncbi:CRISPR-associated endoribonuclease Cas6 [Negadavirga shengliensis]|uniref:CRISPR-associated endoribonuclease Cas6 n=1 Tax=Negadavirga shengliensis TaxID=1389218 RepID=A0ABV9T0M5_9BACT